MFKKMKFIFHIVCYLRTVTLGSCLHTINYFEYQLLSYPFGFGLLCRQRIFELRGTGKKSPVLKWGITLSSSEAGHIDAGLELLLRESNAERDTFNYISGSIFECL